MKKKRKHQKITIKMTEKPNLFVYIMEIMDFILFVVMIVMFWYTENRVFFLVTFGLFLFLSVLKIVSYFCKRNE